MESILNILIHPPGMNAFIVPRALYVESQLKGRIDGGTTWPLATADFYAEDEAQAEISEA